jgi:hypothetical protein
MSEQTRQAVASRRIAAIRAAFAFLGLSLCAFPAYAQSRAGSYDPWSGVRPSTQAPAPPPPSSGDYPAYRPFYSVPRYYPGGGYYDLKRYGNPNSRDALDTCSYC